MLFTLFRSSLIQVVLSEHSLAEEEGFEQVLDVERIFVHYNYNYRTFNNDIMLIKVMDSHDTVPREAAH